ncbi:unnamed protein product [Trichobilharzia regenti]|nr:unnamed protein product [Trichobilharzia regenti]
MTWNDMREAHPSIPPALLRFLLEEYEDGLGVQNTINWSIDEKDAAVVDEDRKLNTKASISFSIISF